MMHPLQLILSALILMLTLVEFFEMMLYILMGPNEC